MTQPEPLNRDSRSYRQGLVLGLTLAEVFMLLLFVLLLSFGALWKTERQDRKALELKLQSVTGEKPQNIAVLRVLNDALGAAPENKVIAALKMARKDSDIVAVSPPEKQFLEEARKSFADIGKPKIDENWQTLVRAVRTIDAIKESSALASTVKEALPSKSERENLKAILLAGREAAVQKTAEKAPGHNWPPIINLTEAGGYSFARGKADLTDPFRKLLSTKVVPDLLALAKEYDVDTIEVIGHTDEQKIAQRPSNLDSFLLDVLQGKASIDTLVPADNAGLGIARAVAVVQSLKADGRLNAYSILPLSGAQLIDTNDKVTSGGGGDDKQRRRIEIRIRRSHPARAAGAHASTPVR